MTVTRRQKFSTTAQKNEMKAKKTSSWSKMSTWINEKRYLRMATHNVAMLFLCSVIFLLAVIPLITTNSTEQAASGKAPEAPRRVKPVVELGKTFSQFFSKPQPVEASLEEKPTNN